MISVILILVLIIGFLCGFITGEQSGNNQSIENLWKRQREFERKIKKMANLSDRKGM